MSAMNGAPGRLWSLWDIMLTVKFEVINRGLMLSARFCDAWKADAGKGKLTQTFEAHQLAYAIKLYGDLSKALRDAGMPIASGHAEGLAKALKGAKKSGCLEGNNFSLATHHIDRLVSVAAEEAGTRLFITISPEFASAFNLFESRVGNYVTDKFPSVAYDFEEAAKCLAFERSTASAFHSIRTLESGIKAISRCLGIPDPAKAADRNWGKMLKSVKDKIDIVWPTSTDRMSGEGQFFEEAYGALAAVQNPWRNATMHLDQKYTLEEAKHILATVEGFMRKLAYRMDEDGNPRA
jgi:hypothetical protein